MNSFKGMAALTVLSLLMLLAAALVPPLGIVFYFFNKAPLVVIFLHYGFKAGLLAYALMAIILIPLSNWEYNPAYLIEYGLIAIIMAGALKLRISISKIIIGCAIVSTSVAVISMAVNPPLEAGSLIEVPAKLTAHMKDDAGNLGAKGGINPKGLRGPGNIFSVMEAVVTRAFPALLLSGAAMGALLNFLVARKMSRKYAGLERFDPGPLSTWASPDKYIWFFIAGGLLAVIPLKVSRTAGLNVVMVMLFVYFLQGLAIVSFFFQRWKLSALFRVLIYVLIFFNVLLSLLVAVVGLFDLWIDFRKLRAAPEDG